MIDTTRLLRGEAFVQQYLNREGLTEPEYRVVFSMLDSLYQVTGDDWRPRNCRNIPRLTVDAIKARRSTPLMPIYFDVIVPKRYLHWHYFWTSESNDGSKTLILDPTGIPLNFPRDDGEIVPYFGLLENCPEPRKTVYVLREDMDDWGTREFPPGFHP